MLVSKDMVRMIIWDLCESECLPDEDRLLLMSLSPVDIEKISARCMSFINIEFGKILHEIKRVRKESRVDQFVYAGASNQVLRALFGLSPRGLTRLRSETMVNCPGRPRCMTIDEEAVMHDYCKYHPVPTHCEMVLANWCLDAHRLFDIPFMVIHRWTSEQQS